MSARLPRMSSVDVEDAVLEPAGRRAHPRTLAQARSYLLIRRTVGYAGALLPTVLILVEVALLDGGFRVRGSLSAYYHSGARDFFVGTLCVVGLMLITYLASQPASWQFVLSLVAGVAAFVVAFVPTRLPAGSPASLLTPIQQRWGEDTAYVIHLGAAAVFILTLAALCLVAARTDQAVGRADPVAGEVLLRPVLLHRLCGTTILLSVAWVVLGVDLGPFTPLYVGEVVAVYAFALSWIVRSRTLARLLRTY